MPLVIQDNDLAVEHGLVLQLLQCCGDRPIALSEGQTVARIQSHLALVYLGDRPVAVPLDLEQPAAAAEGLVDERGEHGTDVGRHRSEWGVLKPGRVG
jgi:hypothetical protein